MEVRHLVRGFVLVLAVASLSLPAFAQHHGDGGHRGGGYHGGYAVPRTGYGYGSPASRHPRAGSGYGYYGGHYGGYRGAYHGHGYYRGGYYPYYRPHYYGYPYFSLGFGWPYDSWPVYTASVSYASAPTYVSDERPAAREPERGASWGDDDRARERDSAWLRVEVRPEDASVYVDDRFRGTGRDSRSLGLPPGLHTVEFVRPGYVTERREVRVETGGRYEVSVELQRPR